MTASEVETRHGLVPIRRWDDGARGVAVVVAHGAGAGHDHPWMVGFCERLARVGFAAWSFEYAYRAAGRRAPDRLPKLLDVHADVVAALPVDSERCVLAGKSMGGRVGGHLVAERDVDVAGLVYLGYPLVAIGRDEPRDTTHLEQVSAPQLFVSGTRDRMGPTDLLEPMVATLPDGRLVTIDDGDHSLVPRKATGRTVEDSLDEAVDAIVAWMADRDIH